MEDLSQATDCNHTHAILKDTFMTQRNVKKGIKLFGEAGVEAIMKELTQLHERGVLRPNSQELNKQERKDALQYLMFLK